MGESLDLGTILAQARKQEEAFDWLGATVSYEKLRNSDSNQNLLRTGEFWERLGYSQYKFSMQSETTDQFTQRISDAIASYRKARGIFGAGQLGDKPRKIRCDAMIEYLSYWLAEQPQEKRRELNEAWRLTKDSLDSFRDIRDKLGYGTTFNQLAVTVNLAYQLEGSYRACEKLLREGARYGERAIAFLSTPHDLTDLARALVKTASFLDTWHTWYANNRESTQDETNGYAEKARDYWLKARKISEETALIESLDEWGQGPAFASDGGETLKKAWQYARTTRDRLLIGYALNWLAIHTSRLRLFLTEIPDDSLGLLEQALKYSEEARRMFSPLSFVSPLGWTLWVESPETEFYHELAKSATDQNKRHEWLEKAIGKGTDLLKRAQDSGYPIVLAYANHELSKALVTLSKMEEPEERREFLAQALRYRKESIKILSRIEHPSRHNESLGLTYLSDLKSELAGLAQNPGVRRRLLKQALLDSEKALTIQAKNFREIPPDPGEGGRTRLAERGRWLTRYGEMLAFLYQTDRRDEDLKRAADAFDEAANSYRRASLPSRAAEAYWNAALTYNGLGDYLRAAESFNLASNSYYNASQKIPAIEEFYQGQASYMQAESEAEKAKHHHWTGSYQAAKECYEQAAKLLESTREWSFMAPNCAAWARVEEGEELSKTDQNEEASRAFNEGSRLFQEVGKILASRIERAEDANRKKMVNRLVRMARLRKEYCDARISQEEARIFFKQGDYYSSSRKSKQAADLLAGLDEAAESDIDRRSIRSMRILVLGLATMSQAEAESSAKLYLAASRLFQKAQNLVPNAKTKALFAGHNKFCRALEAGARFADTKEKRFHTLALRYLDDAGDYYVKAGTHNAAMHTKASKLLVDAYAYLDYANEEPLKNKRTNLYSMAERLLQSSADLYSKAGFSAKNDQVLNLLEGVRNEREIAVSLTELLWAPQPFAPPPMAVPSFETTPGIERFQNSQIQSNIVTRQRNLEVGHDFELRILLVNTGTNPAQLVKLEQAVPEGFDLVEKPQACSVEENHLSLKGKSLSPLKMEELRLVFKPKALGPVQFRPRVSYLDENGSLVHHELDPLDLTVRDTGPEGAAVDTRLFLPSKEFFSGESFQETIEIESIGQAPVNLEGLEGVVPGGFSATTIKGGVLDEEGNINLGSLRLHPSRIHRLAVTLKANGEGRVRLAPQVIFKNGLGKIGRGNITPTDILVHPASPIMDFLVKAFVEDYAVKRLAFEQSGWRSLMNIVGTLGIPKSQAYGETRYGHKFGRPLEAVIRSGIGEYRTFRGKGRGGSVIRVRANYEREAVRRLIEKATGASLGKSPVSE